MTRNSGISSLRSAAQLQSIRGLLEPVEGKIMERKTVIRDMACPDRAGWPLESA